LISCAGYFVAALGGRRLADESREDLERRIREQARESDRLREGDECPRGELECVKQERDRLEKEFDAAQRPTKR